MQKEFSLKMGTFIPFADCANHLQYNDTLYRTIDPEGKVLREFTEARSLEPWGTADFEYYYSRPLTSIKEQRDKTLFADDSFKTELQQTELGNLTIFGEEKIDRPKETYQIYT